MKEPNTLFPGRSDYTGPQRGYFAGVHHDTLFEYSTNIDVRLDYINIEKEEYKRPTYLQNMMHLSFVTDEKYAEYERQRTPLWAEYQRREAPLRAEYQRQRTPLWAEYQRQRAALQAEYQWQEAALRAEYQRQEAALRAEYQRQKAPLLAEYERQKAALRAEYERQEAPLWAEYKRQKAPLRAEYERQRTALPLSVEVLTFVKIHNPGFPWNGRELVFPEPPESGKN